jgi:hypothetical protein
MSSFRLFFSGKEGKRFHGINTSPAATSSGSFFVNVIPFVVIATCFEPVETSLDYTVSCFS